MAFIDKIKEIPIVDHAEKMGFTITRKGKYYSLKEHDSVMIDIQKNCFWRNSSFSSGFKGVAGSIIDFVMEFEGYNDAKSAIDSIASEYGIERDNYKKVVIPKKERVVVESGPKREPGDLALPERDSNTKAVYNYLLNTRKLNKEVVDYFVENDMLYQDKRKNAVFKTDRFACLRSTGQKKFVMDVEGCDYNQCFFFKANENADTLIIGESVIDVMSIMSVYANHGTNFKDFAYLALSGTNKLGSVFYNLENEPGIKNVIIGCDNDQAGRDATAKIIQGLQERKFQGTWKEANAPSGKDWNEYLVIASQREQNQNASRTEFEKEPTKIPDVSLFGKIMQDIYKTAISSEEPVWFLEIDRFEDGEFTQEDLDILNKDIETLKTEFGMGEEIYSIIESCDRWEEADDVVATFYGDFINVFAREKEREKINEDKFTVAIESTDDYADESFHKELINSDIQNEDGSYGKVVDSYRIVTIGENGRLTSYDDKVFTSYKEAMEHAQHIDKIEIVSYDEIVNAVAMNIQKETHSLSQQNDIEINENAAEYKYFSVLRPIGIGAYPREGMKEFQNFDERQYVDELGKEAWGVITYDRMLTETELKEYDLEDIPLKNMNIEQRLQGQELEAAKNMIDSLREIGNVDDEEKGIVNLYYSTEQKTADTILKTKKMKSEDFGDEKGVLLSTEPEPLKDGDAVIRLSVPVESLKLKNYDIESEKATFYLQSEERIFSVKDYDIEMVEVSHGEELSIEGKERIAGTFNELNKVRENMAKERSQNKSETTQENKPRETISFAGASKDEMKEHLVTGIQNIMNSDGYKNWLNTGSKLFYNNYSFNNAMLIWMQKENATHVMGYEGWKEFGRAVQKGAKGAKILMPVMAYEKTQGGLYKMIVSGLNEQFKKDPDLSTAIYKLYSSKIEFTMNKSNMIGLRVNGKEKGIFENHEQLKKFINKNILGKIPMYFTVGTVFDAKDTYTPEFLWVSKGYTKDELVLDDKGNPIKSKKGEYKIYNTPERQARFKPALDTSIVAKDPEKMKVLMDVLKSVSEKNGVPVYMRDKNEDETLRGGAAGYFARQFNDEHPKGYIAIDKDLEITEMCSVMIHEMGHSDMHGSLEKIIELSAEMGEEATSNIRELQAESVAYMTASTFGIETETHSFNYLAAYAQGFDIQGLQKSMDAIYKECKKLTSDIATELDARGLNLDLSKKDPEQMISPKEVESIAQEYVGYVLEREEYLNEIQKEMPSLVLQNKNDENIMAILKEQKENVLTQLDDIDIIKNETVSLEKAVNRNEQNRCIESLEKAKERIEIKVDQFERLSEEFISVRNNRQGTLREEFQKSPKKVLKELSEKYPRLKELSKSQFHYVATSTFIQKNYTALLDKNPELFVNVAMKRAESISEISSKNGVFVEINFCEKWTEQPIFENGVLCHPKVANMIVKNAEEQLQGIRRAAKENGEYFPYSKCDLTIYYNQEKGDRMAFNTRVDIGDGSQKDIISHLEAFSLSKRKDLIENFAGAVKEMKAKDMIARVEITLDDMCQYDLETKEDSKACSMSEWKKQINDRKISAVEKGVNEHNINNSKDKGAQERG